MNQLANGIFAAAVNVLAAVRDIGMAISNLLSPGSPPKLLPDIDKWGMAAMTEFINGFTQADFGAFDELSGTIEGFLRGLSGDVLGKTDLVPTIMKAREAIAQALSGGGDMAGIMAALGPAGEGLAGYVQSMMDLAQANEAVSASQAEVDRLTKEYQDLIKPLDDEISKLDDAESNLADTQRISQLELMANDPNATAAEKERARLQIAKLRAGITRRNLAQEKKGELDLAQTNLDAEKAKQQMAQEQFNNQKQMVQLQAEQNKLIGEQVKLLEQLMKAGGGGGGGGGGGAKGGPKGGGGGLKIPGLGGVFAGVDDGKPKTSPFDALLKDENNQNPLSEMIGWLKLTRLIIGQTMEDIGKALAPVGVAFDAFVGKVAILGLAFVSSGPKIKAALAKVTTFIVTQLGIVLPGVFANFGTVIDRLTSFWTNHGDTVIAAVTFAFKFVVGIIAGALALISGIISIGLQLVIGLWDTWAIIFSGYVETWSLLLQGDFAGAWEKIKETAARAWESISTVLSGVWETIKTTVATALNAVLAIFGTSLEQMGKDWSGAWENVKIILSTAWAWITTKMNEGKAAWQGIWENIKLIVSTVWTDIVTGVTTKATEIYTAVTTKIAELKTWWERIWGEIKTKIETTWTDIVTGVTTKAAEIYTAVTSKIAELKTEWERIWGEIETSVGSAIGRILTAISSKIADFKTLGSDLIQGVVQGITDAASALATAAANVVTGAIAAAKQAITAKSPSEKARKELGQPIGQGVALGVMDTAATAMRAMQDLTGAMFSAPALSAPAGLGAGMSVSTTNNYNLSEHYNTGPRNPRRSFAMMRALSV